MRAKSRMGPGPQHTHTGGPHDAHRLYVRVDADVHIDATETPKAVIEALRRQLRRHDHDRLLQHAGPLQAEVQLLRSDDREHRLPQALLGQLLEVYRRNAIAYEVIDERSQASCPRMRSTIELSDAQTAGLRQLLLRDSGILIGAEADSIGVVAELIARREQRTLVLTRSQTLDATAAALQMAFSAAAPELVPLDAASDEARIVLASYDSFLQSDPAAHHLAYGMIVFDELGRVDPIALIRVLRHARARYLLGLASEAARTDGLHAPLFLALGGIVHHLVTPREARMAKLAYRRRPTRFSASYAGREQYQALLAALASDPHRNASIADDVATEVGLRNPCVVLSERRDHLDAIQLLLPATIASETITSAVRPGDRHAITARFARGELDVLLATGQIASESLSMQRARRLFIAFPFSYGRKLERIIEQLMSPQEGKTEVVVFDYDDTLLPPLHRACEKRSKIIGRLQRSAEKAYADWAQMKLEL